MPQKGTNRKGAPSCSFCGKRHDEVNKLIAGPDVNICDECVSLCGEIVREHRARLQAHDGEAEPKQDAGLCCSFCGKHHSWVETLLTGPGVNICDECVSLAVASLSYKRYRRPDRFSPTEPITFLVPAGDEAASACAAAARSTLREENATVCRLDSSYLTPPRNFLHSILKRSSVVVADVTGMDAAVVFAVGAADAIGKPLILLTREPEAANPLSSWPRVAYEATPVCLQTVSAILHAAVYEPDFLLGECGHDARQKVFGSLAALEVFEREKVFQSIGNLEKSNPALEQQFRDAFAAWTEKQQEEPEEE